MWPDNAHDLGFRETQAKVVNRRKREEQVSYLVEVKTGYSPWFVQR